MLCKAPYTKSFKENFYTSSRMLVQAPQFHSLPGLFELLSPGYLVTPPASKPCHFTPRSQPQSQHLNSYSPLPAWESQRSHTMTMSS